MTKKIQDWNGVLTPRVELVFMKGKWITRPVFDLHNPPPALLRIPHQMVAYGDGGQKVPEDVNQAVRKLNEFAGGRKLIKLKLREDVFEAEEECSSDEEEIIRPKPKPAPVKPVINLFNKPVKSSSSSTASTTTSGTFDSSTVSEPLRKGRAPPPPPLNLSNLPPLPMPLPTPFPMQQRPPQPQRQMPLPTPFQSRKPPMPPPTPFPSRQPPMPPPTPFPSRQPPMPPPTPFPSRQPPMPPPTPFPNRQLTMPPPTPFPSRQPPMPPPTPFPSRQPPMPPPTPFPSQPVPQQAPPAQQAPKGPVMIKIPLQIEEGEPPGMTLDNDLQVIKIQAGSLVDGKMEVGDIIKNINGIKITDPTDFYTKLNRLLSMTIEVERNEERKSKMLASRLPPDYEELIRRKPGCTYSIQMIDTAGKPPGILLETLVNQVAVIKIKDGSELRHHFKEFDVICAIDKIRVAEAVEARELIREKAGRFEVLIERHEPNTNSFGDLRRAFALKQTIKRPDTGDDDEWKGFGAPEDVQQIASEAKKTLKTSSREKLKPIFSGGMRRKSDLKVGLNQKSTEVNIQSDVDPTKQLQHVPKN